MADSKRYQVLTACVVVPVRTDQGEYLQTLFTGNTFESDPEHPRIVHNVESGYISELGATAVAGVDGAGAPVVDDQRVDGAEPGTPIDLNDPGVVNEKAQQDAQANAEMQAADADLTERRATAQAKLPTDGSAPDGRASQATWVEFMVAQGGNYDDLKDTDKKDLQALYEQRQKS